MGRKEQRKAAKKEKNPVAELCKVQRKYVPQLFELFEATADPRNPCYITYPNTVMLGQMFFKGIAGIVSMQGMTQAFNDKTVSNNLTMLMGCSKMEYLPHHVTENEYLERLDPKEIEKVIHQMVYRLLRRRTFEDARYKKRWLIIVDGTQTYSGNRQINENCLERHYDRGTENEHVNYHMDVLEAKIYLGEGLICSIASEFIENSESDRERYRGMNEEQIKQDCELKAFVRLAAKIKKAYPRLPILLLGDSLYACEPVMKICRDYGWDYLLRFKDGRIPSIAEEYQAIPGKTKAGNAEFINGIDYEGYQVNVLRYEDRKEKNGETVTTMFQWITSLQITEKNAEKMAAKGRLRWKIENEGFNRQKNWQGDITHACSFNGNALKNHYLIYQIADFIRQLYEHFSLEKKGIKRTIKNISSALLASFGRQLTGEDISKKRLGKPAFE